MLKKLFFLSSFIPTVVLLPRLVSAAPTQSLDNPLIFSGDNAATQLLLAVVDIFTIIAIPIIVFFIIYAGFLYVTAQGNPANIEKASKALLYAIIGGVIIIGANVIGTIVKNTVDAF